MDGEILLFTDIIFHPNMILLDLLMSRTLPSGRCIKTLDAQLLFYAKLDYATAGVQQHVTMFDFCWNLSASQGGHQSYQPQNNAFFTREIPAKCPYPYHPCMVYLPTYGWFVYGKCREIYHTWIVWDIFAVFLITLKGVIWWHDPCIHKGLIHRNPTIWPLARNKSHRSFGQGSKFMNGIFCWRLVDFVCCSCR